MTASGEDEILSVKVADSEIAFTAASGDTFLRAALRDQVGLPYDCNSGGCGSCQIEVVDGEFEDLWPNAPGLGARARKRGKVLACQCRPTSDCTIKAAPHDRFLPAIAPKRRAVRLVDFRPITQDLAEFTFVSDEGRIDFLAGQYAMLTIPGITGERAYSMSNLANDDGQWSFIIKRMAGGAASNLLFDRNNDISGLEIDGPYGNSYLREDSPRDIVLVAGGSGLSPILSIAARIAQSETLLSKRVIVFFGGRTAEDLCAARELDRMIPGGHGFEIIEAASDEAAGTPADQGSSSAPQGFIHEILGSYLEENALEPGAFDYYFCGPPLMINSLSRMLQLDFKVPQGQLFFDSFL
ncbi:2Fe-2S iron-sulfur cluster-binding protein [Pelagerythrobacter aerophilus]